MERRGGHISITIQVQERTYDELFTDSDEEAIVDFVKEHEDLYDKTNKHLKDKARQECLCDRFTSSCKLSVKVCKTCFKSQRPNSPSLSLANSQRNDRQAEMDSGQISLLEGTHQKEGTR